MKILARNARRGRIYRRTRGEATGQWWEVTPFDARSLIKRLSKRTRPTANEQSMLCRLLRGADVVPMYRYRRGVDPLTGSSFETRHLALVPSDYKLRAVARKPGAK